MHALDTTSWKWEKLADLNIARCDHSSASLGEAAYVACGYGGERIGYLNSVERLGMGVNDGEEVQAWTIINIHKLSVRKNPVFSQIGPDQLCILGGVGY